MRALEISMKTSTHCRDQKRKTWRWQSTREADWTPLVQPQLTAGSGLDRPEGGGLNHSGSTPTATSPSFLLFISFFLSSNSGRLRAADSFTSLTPTFQSHWRDKVSSATITAKAAKNIPNSLDPSWASSSSPSSAFAAAKMAMVMTSLSKSWLTCTLLNSVPSVFSFFTSSSIFSSSFFFGSSSSNHQIFQAVEAG